MRLSLKFKVPLAKRVQARPQHSFQRLKTFADSNFLVRQVVILILARFVFFLRSPCLELQLEEALF